MKKMFFLMLSFVTLMSQSLWPTTDLYLANQEFMTIDKAIVLWGHKPFSAEEFKKGNLTVRSSMAVSLIENRTYIGKSPKQVKEALGDPTGYFWSKDIPAYFLDDGSKEKNHETWQLVFLPGPKGNIGDVKLHKNCCSKDSQYDPGRLPKILKELDNAGKKGN
jgi:hypothetical protein